MEKIFSHSIEYTNREQYTLKEIADSLLAQQALVDCLPELLSKIAPGLTIERVKIGLKTAETGSLKEEFWVAFFLSFQGELQGEVTDLITMLTGVEIPEQYDTIVTLMVLLVVLYTGRMVFAKFKKDEHNRPLAIEGNYNTILNLTAKTINVGPDILSSAVADTVESRPAKSIRDADTRFFRLAKKGGAAPINSNGVEVITAGAVREYPTIAELTVDNDNEIEPFPEVRIEILALDRQKRGVGWAGRFLDNEIEGKRLIMDLAPQIDLSELDTAKIIMADTVVEFKGKDGALVPWKIHILKVIEILE